MIPTSYPKRKPPIADAKTTRYLYTFPMIAGRIGGPRRDSQSGNRRWIPVVNSTGPTRALCYDDDPFSRKKPSWRHRLHKVRYKKSFRKENVVCKYGHTLPWSREYVLKRVATTRFDVYDK